VSIENNIRKKIEEALTPRLLDIVNESHKHSSGLGAESHFKILIVSNKFEGMNRLLRQRFVYDLLAEEMKSGIHALSLRLLTTIEMDTSGEFSTPNCQGKK
jgi:BolA family transcriptional regulator, general stress-responsive regulator